MGYYIETNATSSKAAFIVKNYGGVIIPQPKSFSEVPENKALICVVDNRLFEAAGYCYSADEFKAFTDPEDPRPKQWLLMDKETAQTLSHFIGSYDHKKMMEKK